MVVFRSALLKAQQGLCGVCAKPADPRTHVLEVDHILPLAEGGGHDLSNLQVLHVECHAHKTREETLDWPASLRDDVARRLERIEAGTPPPDAAAALERALGEARAALALQKAERGARELPPDASPEAVRAAVAWTKAILPRARRTLHRAYVLDALVRYHARRAQGLAGSGLPGDTWCAPCGRAFANPSQHRYMVHGKGKASARRATPPCPGCARQLSTPANLRRHLLACRPALALAPSERLATARTTPPSSPLFSC
jgi:hypothetical protein